MGQEVLGSLISGGVVAIGGTGLYFLFKMVFGKKEPPAPK